MSEAARQHQFETLLDEVLDPAYGLALRFTRRTEDAEDIVQEAALLAYRAFHTFQVGTNFKAWFFRIVTNVFRQRYRKSKREPETTDLDDPPVLYLYCRTAEAGLHARAEDPAALVLGRLDTEQVTAAIDGLPEEYRVAATLYLLEELSYEEIAGILDCPIGTVRSRLHRGRRLLQKALWQIAEQQGVIAALVATQPQEVEKRATDR